MVADDEDTDLDELPVAEPDPKLTSKIIFNDNEHGGSLRSKIKTR